MKTRWLAVVALLSVYSVWFFVLPVFNTHPEQDACEFGSVGNARYQELLAEAKRRTRDAWPSLRGVRVDQAENIKQRISDLNAGSKSLPERIAGVHAVMRAAGGYLYNLPLDRKREMAIAKPQIIENWEFSFHGVPLVHLPYAFRNSLLGTFDAVDRYSDIIVRLEMRTHLTFSKHRKYPKVQLDEFHAHVRYASFLARTLRFGGDGLGLGQTINPHLSCPPIPSIEWLATYKKWIALPQHKKWIAPPLQENIK